METVDSKESSTPEQVTKEQSICNLHCMYVSMCFLNCLSIFFWLHVYTGIPLHEQDITKKKKNSCQKSITTTVLLACASNMNGEVEVKTNVFKSQ